MKHKEELSVLVDGVGNYLAEYLEKSGPVTAVFRPYGLRFAVAGTKNQGVMRLEYHGPGELSLQLGVFRKGTDRLYSNYLLSTTKEEMLRYLRDPASRQVWLEQVEHLSARTDDYWKRA